MKSTTLRSHIGPRHFPTPDGKGITKTPLADVAVIPGDILVVAKDFPTHIERRLRAAGRKLKPSKRVILKEKVLYLGHNGNSQGVATKPEKIEAICKWKLPRNIK